MQSTGYFSPMVIEFDFLQRFLYAVSNFTKIRPVGAELTHADRRTDRHDEAGDCPIYRLTSPATCRQKVPETRQMCGSVPLSAWTRH
jgi:hypothetical protein